MREYQGRSRLLARRRFRDVVASVHAIILRRWQRAVGATASSRVSLSKTELFAESARVVPDDRVSRTQRNASHEQLPLNLLARFNPGDKPGSSLVDKSFDRSAHIVSTEFEVAEGRSFAKDKGL
jgi:hypothetical protein